MISCTRGAITNLDNFPATLPERVVLTDDPLRAKMLAAHHLEYSSLVYELGDVLVFSGSYNSVPIAVVSSGFGSGVVLALLGRLKKCGAAKVIYIGECVSTTGRHGLRSVILGSGGSPGLSSLASAAAGRCDIPAVMRTVLPSGASAPEEGCISDEVTFAMYERAKDEGFEALSILTVSEDAKNGEIMEGHERRSRFYAASRLAFETFAMNFSVNK